MPAQLTAKLICDTCGAVVETTAEWKTPWLDADNVEGGVAIDVPHDWYHSRSMNEALCPSCLAELRRED